MEGKRSPGTQAGVKEGIKQRGSVEICTNIWRKKAKKQEDSREKTICTGNDQKCKKITDQQYEKILELEMCVDNKNIQISARKFAKTSTSEKRNH